MGPVATLFIFRKGDQIVIDLTHSCFSTNGRLISMIENDGLALASCIFALALKSLSVHDALDGKS